MVYIGIKGVGCISADRRMEQSETAHQLLVNIEEMSKAKIQYWLVKFVAEVKRKDGNYYPPDTVYQICCGLGRALY